jgi:subtilisin family serine protease
VGGGGTGAVVAAVFAGVAVVAIAVFWQAAGWVADQILLQLDVAQPWWMWPLISVILSVLVVPPALLLATIPKALTVRQAGRAWLCAAVVAGLGGLLRLIPDQFNEAYLACLAMVCAVLALVVRRLVPGPPSPGVPGTRSPAAVPLALAAGGLTLLPWLAFGALGGLLETVLAVIAAATVGWVAASILDSRFWAPYAVGGRARLVAVGGLVAGVALALIAAGLGASGTQLLALLTLPPLGFAAAALAPGSSRAIGWLVGTAVVGPLAFADPDEITLFLLGRDIPFWISIAAACCLAIGLLVGLTYALTLLKRVIPDSFGAPGVGFTPRSGRVAAGVAVMVLLAGAAVYAFAGQPGLHGEQLFVVMKEQASLAGLPATTGPGPARDARVAAVYRRLVEHADASQADLRRQLDRWNLKYQPYYLVNGLRVVGGPAVRAWLSRRSDVDRVLLDPVLRPLPEPLVVDHGGLAKPTGVGWNIQMVGAPAAWAQGVTGQGIVVGTSDSGVDGAHEALAGGYRGGDDSWFDPWEGTTTPGDHNGHGTHTLASAVGRGGIGVAPGAQWIGCVNLERNMGSPSYYLDCLQFMLAPFPQGGNPFTDGRPARAPHVLTNSWGCPEVEGCDADSLRPAIDALAAAGIAFVAAAGNSGPRCGSITDPPAIYRSAITVAAVGEDRTVADFSSRGAGPLAKPDVAAPGEAVVSAMPGNTYAELDGTSMATPHVAGLIALMWSQNPALIGDLDATRARLRSAATPARLDTSSSGCADLAEQAGAGIAHFPRPPSR